MEWVKPFFDTASGWWGRPQMRESDQRALDQFGRCYTPADLLLLLEGTGLAAERIENRRPGNPNRSTTFSDSPAMGCLGIPGRTTPRHQPWLESRIHNVEKLGDLVVEAGVATEILDAE